VKRASNAWLSSVLLPGISPRENRDASLSFLVRRVTPRSSPGRFPAPPLKTTDRHLSRNRFPHGLIQGREFETSRRNPRIPIRYRSVSVYEDYTKRFGNLQRNRRLVGRGTRTVFTRGTQ
jgi:hypothetical protein